MTPEPQRPEAPPLALAGVRFSLPEMLRELTAERSAATFAMEKLDQQEIRKLFRARAPRRVQS